MGKDRKLAGLGVDSVESIGAVQDAMEYIKTLAGPEVLAALGVATAAGVAAPPLALGLLGVYAFCRWKRTKQQRAADSRDEIFKEWVKDNIDTLRSELRLGEIRALQQSQMQLSLTQSLTSSFRELLELEFHEVQWEVFKLAAEVVDLQSKIDFLVKAAADGPCLVLNRPNPNGGFLYFSNMRIPFCGRDAEWKRLVDFLESEAPFSWWRIIGPGGVGKSRLAVELCWYATFGGWRAGFLNPTDPGQFNNWQAQHKTLIVVDYIFARWNAAYLADLMDQIRKDAGRNRVRILVLERQETGEWWKAFRRTQGDSEARMNSEFRPDREDEDELGDQVHAGPLALEPMSECTIANMIEFVLRKEGVEFPREDIDRHAARFLREIDKRGNPLFAALYAEAIADNPSKTNWSRADTMGAVLGKLIQPEVAPGPGVEKLRIDPKHVNLLVLATLVGGIRLPGFRDPRAGERSKWELPEGVDWKAVWETEALRRWLPEEYDLRQVEFLGSFSIPFDIENPFLAPLEPDPLGEALALFRYLGSLDGRASGESPENAREATESILVAAGDLAPQYSSAWIDRALQDYPEMVDIDRMLEFQRVARWMHIPDDISRFQRLEHLDLSSTQVEDVSALSNLTALTSLDLSYTQVQDMSALSNLTALKRLDLWATQVEDVSALSNLAALTSLDLSNTKVHDVSALSNLTALTSLSLRSTGVEDVSALSSLTALTSLDLRITNVEDVTALSNLTALKRLDLWATQVEDVSALSSLTALNSLDLRNTNVEDVSALSNLTALLRLDLSYTQVQDVSALSNLTALTSLNLRNTNVEDVSALSNLTALVSLNLWNTQVQDVSALSNMTSLTELYLSDPHVPRDQIDDVKKKLPTCMVFH